MESSLLVPPALRTHILRRSPIDGEAWLARLPQLCDQVCRSWDVQRTGTPKAGATALVVPVVGAYGRAAVKLVSPVAEASREATALEAFNGQGVVRLLRFDPSASALLIEWLDGPDLTTTPDTTTVMRIAGELTREMSGVNAPAGVRTLAGGAHDWATMVQEQHRAAEQKGIAMPAAILTRALEVIDELSRDPTTTLTHGDLSLTNILRAGPDRWLAIDPAAVQGTAAHEAHTVVRGRLPQLLAGDRPAAQMEAWTREFTDAADVDHGLALRLSFARYLASFYWEAQSGGDPVDVNNLREGVRISAEIC